MHWATLPSFLAIAVAGGSANPNLEIRDEELPANAINPVARSFIVEYAPGALRARDALSIASAADIAIVKTFESSFFEGAAVETGSHNLDTLLLDFPEVIRVWPNKQIQLSPVTPQAVFDDAASASEYNPHNATGVSKLHALGYFGEGVVVGVVDTGTAYEHPALGGCLGEGCKVVGGWDLIGDGLWPAEEPTPDDDPQDYQGHGTHVAGIIAGETSGWTGVAPKASIRSYKVFGQGAGTTEAVLIESFLMAFDDGVDIITASIGANGGWAEDAWAEVASRIVREGVVVTIAAGNAGAAGPFFGLGNGASGKDVIGVASVQAESQAATPFETTFSLGTDVNTTTMGYLAGTYYFPAEVKDWPIIPLNFNTSEVADGCEPYPEDAPRFDNAIPLVRRGTCLFSVKQQNLEALGARYVLVYNNEIPIIMPATEATGSLLGLITAEAGEAIIEAVQAGANVTADFSLNPEQPVGLPFPSAGLPSNFSSWGATYDLDVKPDIAAPGGEIYSTYLDGQYAILSGTSMACPYVAGVAALYIGVHGGRKEHGKGFARMLAQRIISSGASVPWYDTQYDLAAPVAQVGNGLVNAFKVVEYRSSIEFEKMALNDTRYFSRYHDITVKNDGNESTSYSFSRESAAGIEMVGWYPLPPFPGNERLRSFRELVPVELEPEVTLPGSFTLQPGQSKTVSVNFKNPDTLGWNSSSIPLYSGKVIVSSSAGEQLSVPYLGIGTDLKGEMDPMYRVTYPFSQSQFVSYRDKNWYTLNISLHDFPIIYSKIKWGTREVRWDIYEGDWKERDWEYPPVPGHLGHIGSIASWVGSGNYQVWNPRYGDPDETFTYPMRDLIRTAETEMAYHEHWWFGKLANGSYIEPGNYTIRFATLKPFGNPGAADNWDVWHAYDSPTPPRIEILSKFST